MPERPRHVEQPSKPSKPEAVVGVRREAMRPDVREYAQNLEAQIRELYERRKTLDKAELLRLSALTKQLSEIVEQGDLSAEAYEERAIQLLEEAKRYVGLLKSSEWVQGMDGEARFTNIAYAELASAEADMDRLDEANETVKRIEGKGTLTDLASVYQHIAEAEIRARRNPDASLDKAVRSLIRVGGNTRDLIPQLDRLTDVFIDAFDFEQAKTMWNTFSIGGLGKETVDHRIALLEVRFGRLDDAKRTASMITDPQKQIDAFCVLAVAEANAGHDPTATFTAAIDAVKHIRGPWDKANRYVEIALAQVEAGQTPRKALNLIKSKAGELPDLSMKGRLFSSIALVEAKAGSDPSLSFARAKEMAAQIHESKSSVVLLEIGLNEVKAGRFEDAKKTAFGIINDPGGLVAYQAIIRELLEAGRSEDALELLKANERIDGFECVRLYCETIDVEVRNDENPDETLATAREIAEKIMAPVSRFIAFGTLALATARANRDPSALFAAADLAVREESDPLLLNQGYADLVSFKAKAAVAYHQRAKERNHP